MSLNGARRPQNRTGTLGAGTDPVLAPARPRRLAPLDESGRGAPRTNGQTPGAGAPVSASTGWQGARDLPVRDRLAGVVIDALAQWTPYVESEIRGLREVVRPGATCIDIGAAAGIYTLALSRLAGPSGRVHSIEPLPFANLQLARILNVGRSSNVRQHALALSAEPGIDIMSVPVGRFGLVTGRSFLDRSAGGPDPNAEFPGRVAIMVTVDTLDALCAREGIERLDFLKIDVEGAELEVLEGGKEAIETLMPSMLIEIEARHAARYRRTTDDVTAWMLDRGYSMYTWHHGWQPVPSISPGTRNYLFRPPHPGERPRATNGRRPTSTTA